MEGGQTIEDEDGESSFYPQQDSLSIEEELEQFRRQWQKELRSEQQAEGKAPRAAGPSTGGTTEGAVSSSPQPSVEEQAKYLFLQGVNAEQCGRLYEAIRYYRKAVQLVPDIEFRIDDFKPTRTPRRERFESECSVESVSSDVVEEEENLEDLVAHFHKLKVDECPTCMPAYEPRSTHLSVLPVELLIYIFKWVVSVDVDVQSLEELAAVSRGFYVCARDEELWKLICHRIWGVNCGSPTNYGSYRNMFVHRPHLRYNGCYISKASYVRQGEQGLDNFYRPYQLVEYYRYVRFFPEGQMLMLTTPDDPYMTLGKLKHRDCKVQGLLHGYYRIAGDLVTCVMKRRKVKDYTSPFQRYRRNQNQNEESDAGQTFHAEFVVHSTGRKSNSQLTYNHYSVHTLYRSTGEETVAEFELTNKTYPPMYFSRVKSYNATTDGPLK